jgi:flagellar biosynthetic protein FliQ
VGTRCRELGEEFWLKYAEALSNREGDFMNEDMIISIGADAIKTTIYLAGPMLLAAMAVGIVVSILQAITQINEATLTFIPKMIAVVVVLMVMAPWMIETMSQYATGVLGNAGEWIR